MSLQLQNIDAVLFDLDGTLLDSAPDLASAANQLRLVRGMQVLPHAHYRPFVGTGARGMLRIALDVQPDAPQFEQLKEEFFVAYEQCMGQHSQLFEGVPHLLQVLQGHAEKWGIVTNKSERFTLPIVRSFGVLAIAESVVCGDTTAHAKPHPAPLLGAAKRLEVLPERCIY
ncbi:MAG: HAD hydrolase-like protein, partial [Comamonas sp.]|nr:HAD hydrolase-like protein [Candidatus Comamonas equi]